MNTFRKKIHNLFETRKSRYSHGFTLVETLVAVAILTVTIGALLTLTTGGFYAVRYSRNDIVANNLLQESLEYIRNNRDNNTQQGGGTWDSFISSYDVDGSGKQTGSGGARGCFFKSGCIVDAYTDSGNIKECSSGLCSALIFYPNQQFYGYEGATYPHIFGGVTPYGTSFIRTIYMNVATLDSQQLIVTANITWLNGNSTKSLTQSIVLNNWQL